MEHKGHLLVWKSDVQMYIQKIPVALKNYDQCWEYRKDYFWIYVLNLW